jgi:hypothetical protein
VQQDDAPLGAVAQGGTLERVDQLHQRAVQPVDGVAVAGGELGEELEAAHLVLVLVDVLGAVRQDHVVQALVRRAGDPGVSRMISRYSSNEDPSQCSFLYSVVSSLGYSRA